MNNDRSPHSHSAASSASPALASIAAQLYVRDIKAACEFFTTKLGFTVEFLHGDPPFYGRVKRDAARLALRSVWEPVFVGDIREREQLLSAAMTVDSTAAIEALFQEFQSTGVAFHEPLKLQPWGAKSFIVRDLDGNLLLFSGPGA